MYRKKIYASLVIASLFLSAQIVQAKMTKEAHALYQQACSYEYKSDYNTAIKIIQQALDINGEDAMLYTKIAGLYSDIGQYENALSAYKKALHLRPNDAFIYISVGNILQTMGDYDNAFKAFSQAQTIYPEYKYNYLNLANIEYFRKNYTTAAEYYNTFLSVYPEHVEASENLADVYYLSNQPDKACDMYDSIYKKYPSAFTDFDKYGIALFDTKQYQAAAEMLEKALQADEDNEVILAKLALTYQSLGENEKSLKMFKRTFNINPEFTSLRFDYANLLGNMNLTNEAIEQYKAYIQAYPEDADAYKNLGLVYKKINNMDLALFNLEKAYSKDSSDVQIKKELALCYHFKSDYVNALRYYDAALKAEPDNIELLANKALTLHAMKNYIPAIEIYKEILAKQQNERIEQNLTSASIAYAYDLYDKEDYGQAILYFEDAIEMNNKEASAYFGYARANAKMGCVETALANYEKAASLAPSNIEYATELANYRKICNKPDKNTQATASKATTEPLFKVTPSAVEENTTNVNGSEYGVLISKGDEAYKNQKYDEAIDCYAKAAIYNPTDKITMLKIANIYKLLGNNNKAIDFYDRILTIEPKNTDAVFNKGLVLANQKKYDDCIKCFEKVVELSPDYPYAYYSLGMAYEQKGLIDKALEYYYLYTGLETNDKVLNIVNQRIKQLETGK